MNRSFKVRVPPQKPVLIFDGECGFCGHWIERWQQATGNKVEYIASQDPMIAARFPEIPKEEFSRSIQLIDVDGFVRQGAEAVFCSRAVNPQKRWALWAYRKVPGVAEVAEWCYRFVADHRSVFSALMRWNQPDLGRSHTKITKLTKEGREF